VKRRSGIVKMLKEKTQKLTLTERLSVEHTLIDLLLGLEHSERTGRAGNERVISKCDTKLAFGVHGPMAVGLGRL